VVEVEVDGLAGFVAEVLHPGAAGLPGDHDETAERPRGKARQMEQPVGDERKLVVVVRVAQAEEAQEVFIHK